MDTEIRLHHKHASGGFVNALSALLPHVWMRDVNIMITQWMVVAPSSNGTEAVLLDSCVVSLLHFACIVRSENASDYHSF